MNTDATNAVAEGLDPVKTRLAVPHHPLTPTLRPPEAGGDVMTDDRTKLLLTGMGLLVPLWIARVAAWPPADRQAAADAAADLISCGADQLWEPDRRKHDLPRGQVISAIARGLALLAYAPGGVTWAGSHWCVAPHQGCPGPSAGWVALFEQGATW